MTSYIGLYYPLLEFKDDGWLKLTALYWDRMGRIVPVRHVTEDSDTVQQLQDHGYVVDFDPEYEDRILVGEAFSKLVTEHASSLRQRYAPMEAPTKSDVVPGAGWSLVLTTKMDRNLVHALKEEGLAVIGHGRVGMEPKFAQVYMTSLAGVMAEARRMPHNR